MKESQAKEVFVTYSWDSEDHKLRVLSFFNYLRKKGFHTDIDRKVSQEQTSIDFYKMMHSVMTDYKKIIIVLSKGYKIKADSFSGGVGTEYGLIIKDIDENPKKYILVSFDGINDSILPLNFKGREIVDLSNSENEEILFLKLLDIPVFDIDPIASEKPKVTSKKIPDFKFDGKTKINNPSNSKRPVTKKKNDHQNIIRSAIDKLFNLNFSKHNIIVIIIAFSLFSAIGYQQLSKSLSSDITEAKEQNSPERNNSNFSPGDSIIGSQKLFKRSSSDTIEVKEQSLPERNNSNNSSGGIIKDVEFVEEEPLVSNHGVFLKGIAKESATIYKKPSTRSQKVGSREPFDVLYLFETDDGFKLENGFYKVGYEPTKAIGWIEGYKITEWDNRICLKFTPLVGRLPALIWKKNEVEDLIRGVIDPYDRNGAPNKNAVAQEPGDMSQNNYSMLLPALQTKSFITSVN